MIISLLGFMGVGKTSVGKMLANRLHYEFVDTDDIIVEKSGLTIPEIFSSYGEEYFRNLEEKTLKGVLTKDNMIIATGGGIVLSAINRKRLKEYTCPVLLTASPSEIYKRTNIKKRPLLANADNPRQVIKELLIAREKYYNKFMTRVNTDGKMKWEVVEEIIKITGVENGDKKNKC